MKRMAEEKQVNREWLVPLLIAGVVVGAFFTGRLSSQVEYLTRGSTTAAPQPAAQGTNQGTAQAALARDLSIDALKGYAKDIGLDQNKFDSCLDTGKYA